MRITFLGRCISPAKKIILNPSSQITLKFNDLKEISKCQPKSIMNNSTKTNQSPRFSKNIDSSFGDFLLPIIKADSPARKLNAGAQKLVINLVKKSGTVVSVGSFGSKN
jgi:hypothetical protein